MATGQPAFGGDTTGVVFDAVLNRTPGSPTRLNPEVPSKLGEIIVKLLDKDRKLRYQSAAELETDLKRLRRGTGASLPIAQAVPHRKWRRARVLVPTALLIMTAIVTIVLLRAPRAATLTEQDVILLADFENKTGDPVFDDTLKQATEFALEQSPFINLFPEESVRQTLRLMEHPADERITDAVAREMCRRAGLKGFLGGSIAPLGNSYVMTLKAENCATGRSIAGEQRQASSKELVLTELGQAAASLRAKLGESLASIQRFDKPLEQVTTNSLGRFETTPKRAASLMRVTFLGQSASLNRRSIWIQISRVPTICSEWNMETWGIETQAAKTWRRRLSCATSRVSGNA